MLKTIKIHKISWVFVGLKLEAGHNFFNVKSLKLAGVIDFYLHVLILLLNQCQPYRTHRVPFEISIGSDVSPQTRPWLE